MAFFKFRKGGDEQAAPPSASESVEAMRARARHRLIGASLLVLAGVIGFPLVFDSQPRPVAVDIPIEIPDKQSAKPLVPAEAVVPAQPVSAAPAQVVVENDGGRDVTPPAPVASRSAAGALGGALAAASKPAPKLEAKPQKKEAVEVKKPVEEKKPTEKVSSSKPDDGAKAQALLEGRDVPQLVASAPAASRFVVQIGAYADAAKAQEVRLKLERAGLKTYTQVVQPKEGKRIRVRVGPFESKAQADKTVERIKKLDLSASVLEL